MALDPALARMVEKASRYPPMHRVPLADLRAAMPRLLSSGLPAEEVASVDDREIVGPRGPIRLRVYRPALPLPHPEVLAGGGPRSTRNGGGSFEADRPSALRDEEAARQISGDAGARHRGPPLTVFFHGSGFTICSIETHDAICRQICRRAGTVVVSVGYRLAPENPYPAGPEDCWAATVWADAHRAEIGAGDAPLAVCGDSAGGTMATLVAMRARQEGGPAIAAQILIYPVTDHYSAGHASHDERGAGCGMTREDMRFFWTQYLPDVSMADLPTVSPARAPDLSGLPPAFIVTAEYDVLRDEGAFYARRLAEAGAPVTHRHYPTLNHGFLHHVGVVGTVTQAMDDLGAWMKAALAPATESVR